MIYVVAAYGSAVLILGGFLLASLLRLRDLSRKTPQP
jgi:heme exporter protein CcmD